MALEYLRSTPRPSIEDAKACLAELARQMGPCPLVKQEHVLEWLVKGATGADLGAGYSRSLAEVADLPDSRPDEDLWIELHFGLLYAATNLPSAPIVLRSPQRSLDQYNVYFSDVSDIDFPAFNAKTGRLASATIMRLDRRLNPFIKGGGHPKALRTTVTPEHLNAYRVIRNEVIGHESNLDVANHSELWQFLMDLAAKLHPDLALPQNPDSEPVQSTNLEGPPIRSHGRWYTVERHALWRCINRWCKEHGVDAFTRAKFNQAKCAEFAEEIKVDCAGQGRASDRSWKSVQGQIKDALRKNNPAVPNKRITDLADRAEKLRAKIKRGDPVSEQERKPEAAIEIPRYDESDDGLEGSGTGDDEGGL